jgi:hypothetical protein
MRKSPIRCPWAGCVLIALAPLTASAADIPADQNNDASPVVIAQARTPGVGAPQVVSPANGFPPNQRGVRQAAAASNEALRRYIWRTRMIYNFYYKDFAPKD